MSDTEWVVIVTLVTSNYRMKIQNVYDAYDEETIFDARSKFDSRFSSDKEFESKSDVKNYILEALSTAGEDCEIKFR